MTAFYWAVLWDGDLSYTNICKHGVIQLLLLVDLCLSRIPVVSYHYTVSMVSLVLRQFVVSCGLSSSTARTRYCAWSVQPPVEVRLALHLLLPLSVLGGIGWWRSCRLQLHRVPVLKAPPTIAESTRCAALLKVICWPVWRLGGTFSVFYFGSEWRLF